MKALATRLATVLVVLACLLPAVGCRSIRDMFSRNREYDTLVVTGNYVDSRLLAELIQDAREHPILLLPTGEDPVMYLLGAEGAATRIQPEDLEWLVDYLSPRTIIFLGDESYAPKAYRDRLKDRWAVATYDNGDWEVIARSVGELLDIKDLEEDYRELRRKLDRRGRVKPEKDFNALFARDTTSPTTLEQVLEERRQQEAAKKAAEEAKDKPETAP